MLGRDTVADASDSLQEKKEKKKKTTKKVASASEEAVSC